VIDPHTQTTVYAESADGTGAASTLESIDTVTAALRGKLGEALESVEKNSAPLPQVATSNLDALRAYALGQKAYARGNTGDALRFYQRAAQLDPKFALAWIGQVRSQYAGMNAPAAVQPLRNARALRKNLSPREALYLEAWAAAFDDPARALDKWIELATLYPDYFPAQTNAVIWLYAQNRFAEALPYFDRLFAVQNDLLPIAYDALGRVRLGLGQYAAAAKAYDQALIYGYKDSLRRRADVDAARRDYAGAERFLQRTPASYKYSYIEKVTVAIDQGRWLDARNHAETAEELVSNETGFDNRMMLMPVAISQWVVGQHSSAARKANEAANRALNALKEPYDANAEDDAGLALSAALLGIRLGDRPLADKVLTALATHKKLMATPALRELETVVRAEGERLSGRPQEAIKMLAQLITGHERYQTRVALLAAYATNNDVENVTQQAEWLQNHRGLAYMELGCGQCLQALNVIDSNLAALQKAELLVRSGKPTEAKHALEEFDRIWPSKILPDHLRARRAAVFAASKAGGV
jgi:putative peptide modification system cyclase